MKQVRANLSCFFRLHPSPGRRSLRRQWMAGTPVLLILAVIAGRDVPDVISLLLLGPILLALLLYDTRYLILPDVLVAMVALTGLVTSLAFPGSPGFPSPPDAVLGAIAGGCFLWLIRAGYHLFRGTEGLGAGDVKLFAASGCWVGWENLADLLLVACLATFGAIILARLRQNQGQNQGQGQGQSQRWQNRMPFGPGLTVALYSLVLLSRSGLAALLLT